MYPHRCRTVQIKEKKMLDKNSASGKGIRTALQAAVGLVGLTLAVYAVPEVKTWVDAHVELAGVIVAALAGAVSFLQNKLGK